MRPEHVKRHRQNFILQRDMLQCHSVSKYVCVCVWECALCVSLQLVYWMFICMRCACGQEGNQNFGCTFKMGQQGVNNVLNNNKRSDSSDGSDGKKLRNKVKWKFFAATKVCATFAKLTCSARALSSKTKWLPSWLKHGLSCKLRTLPCRPPLLPASPRNCDDNLMRPIE